MFEAFKRKLQGNQTGITGLETAIIMIAFVVVASVFAYVVISSGLFATEKSKETINKGLEAAQGALVLKGCVLAVCEHSGPGGYISQFSVSLTNEMGGAPIDFAAPLTTGDDGISPDGSDNKVVISYVDPYQKVDNLFWTVDWLGANNGDNLLDGGEMVQITIGSDTENTDGGNLCDALTVRHLQENTKFTIQITGAAGSVLSFDRDTPPYLSPNINLN